MASSSPQSRSQALSWEVQLPEKGRASLGGRKPLARVILDPEGTSEEEFRVPVAVGRILASVCKEDPEIGSRAELLYLIGEKSRTCARDRIIRMIERRDHSSSEAKAKLALDGYGLKVREEAVGRAMEVGLLDDARFADIFIRSKISCGWGSIRIGRELRSRGIDIAEVPGWPEEYLEEDEYDRAFELASRKPLSKRLSYESIARFLASRGFSSGICSSVASRIRAEAREEAEGE